MRAFTRPTAAAVLFAVLLGSHVAVVTAGRKSGAKSKAQTQELMPEQLTSAEIAHRKNQRFFFSIGEGFEGSASDWTEYLVWSIGVIGVFYYMSSPHARRNPYEDDDEGGSEEDVPRWQQPPADGDDTFAPERSSNSSSGARKKVD